MRVTNGANCAVQLRHQLWRCVIERHVTHARRESADVGCCRVELTDELLLGREQRSGHGRGGSLVLAQRLDERHPARHERASLHGRRLAILLEEPARFRVGRLRLDHRESGSVRVVGGRACQRHQNLERSSNPDAPRQDELLHRRRQHAGQIQPPQHPAQTPPETNREPCRLEPLHVDQLPNQEPLFQSRWPRPRQTDANLHQRIRRLHLEHLRQDEVTVQTGQSAEPLVAVHHDEEVGAHGRCHHNRKLLPVLLDGCGQGALARSEPYAQVAIGHL